MARDYLIVEYGDDGCYVYTESKEHFASVEKQRAASRKRLSLLDLDADCEVPTESYIVFDLTSLPPSLPQKVVSTYSWLKVLGAVTPRNPENDFCLVLGTCKNGVYPIYWSQQLNSQNLEEWYLFGIPSDPLTKEECTRILKSVENNYGDSDISSHDQ